MTTVEEYFEIDEDDFHQQHGNDYWEKAQDFYSQVKSKEVKALSQGQFQWLTKIEKQMKGES